MARPILYSFRRCPYAMRARLALLSAGIACTHREILLKDKPAAMLEASPKGTVPVLVLPDGPVIDESLDVAFWALREHDPEGWLAPWNSAPDAADALLKRNDGPFKHHLDRYKYSTRYEGEDMAEHRAAGLEILKDLDKRLSDQPYLGGDNFTFLDAGIAPFIRQFRIADPDWFDSEDLPHLQAWLQKFLDRSDFAVVMTKYPVWDGKNEDRFPRAAV